MRFKEHFDKIDLKLYVSLIFLGLFPTLYLTLRTNFLGSMPGEYSYSIAGQLSWVNLLYEIVNEAIILPLFFFVGGKSKKEFENRMTTGMFATGIIYTIFAGLIIIFVNPLLKLMSVSPEIIGPSAVYIRIESIAAIFSVLVQFVLVGLITIGHDKDMYVLTVMKCVIIMILDTFLVSQLPVSLKLGVNGIGFSNIISNAVMLVICILLLKRRGYSLRKGNLDFTWMKDFRKIGSLSGLESLVRNVAYMVMISKMVNVVSAQGVYWVANNFIWGWLLLPILQLGELIKKEVSEDVENVRQNTSGYLLITMIVCVFWILLIPLYKPFMVNVLGYTDVEELYSLVMLLLVPYIFFAVQNVFDAEFYGRGAVEYMLAESIVTNTIYYGVCFILYKTGFWVPTLRGIALMFGFGNIFDSVVSAAMYVIWRRKMRTI